MKAFGAKRIPEICWELLQAEEGGRHDAGLIASTHCWAPVGPTTANNLGWEVPGPSYCLAAWYPSPSNGGRVQASSLHSIFMEKQHVEDSIWSCSNRRYKLVWEGVEEKGAEQEQGKEDRAGTGEEARVQMEGGAECRLRMMLGGKEWWHDKV